jgi:hypothetical protein
VRREFLLDKSLARGAFAYPDWSLLHPGQRGARDFRRVIPENNAIDIKTPSKADEARRR